MEVGYTQMPQRGELPVAILTPKRRGIGALEDWAQYLLAGPGFGFAHILPPGDGSSRDSFGNLECSPPVTVGGKEFRFGRIIYGEGSAEDDINPRVIDFLKAQRVQSPFSIDTSWLAVGHVDEIFSFCPMLDAPRKFRVLLASTRSAMSLVKRLIENGLGNRRFFENLPISDWHDLSYFKEWLPYKDCTPDQMTANAFAQDQARVQVHIDQAKERLKSELGLQENDFVELPVLFRPVNEGSYVALTPGVVNALVLTRPNHSAHLVIPKPFAMEFQGHCVFETEIKSRLQQFKGSGLTYHFVDDFEQYHVLMGEIHCGTNSHRRASADVFWWEQEVIR